MSKPKTLRQSLSELKQLLLDWNTPPHTWVRPAIAKVWDFSTSKAGLITYTVTVSAGLLYDLHRWLDAQASYYEALRQSLLP